jgi:hypothetical protein
MKYQNPKLRISPVTYFSITENFECAVIKSKNNYETFIQKDGNTKFVFTTSPPLVTLARSPNDGQICTATLPVANVCRFIKVRTMTHHKSVYFLPTQGIKGTALSFGFPNQ